MAGNPQYPDPENIGQHQVTIAVPGATAESLGLPDHRRQGGAWVMNAGTTTAHINDPGTVSRALTVW